MSEEVDPGFGPTGLSASLTVTASFVQHLWLPRRDGLGRCGNAIA